MVVHKNVEREVPYDHFGWKPTMVCFLTTIEVIYVDQKNRENEFLIRRNFTEIGFVKFILMRNSLSLRVQTIVGFQPRWSH